MKLTRRSFLEPFGLTAAGLFVPTKTIFLPPAGGWGNPTTGFADFLELEFRQLAQDIAAHPFAYQCLDWRRIGIAPTP